MDVSKQKRRSEYEIITLMEEFEKSRAMTVQEFCEAYEISNATFYNWQKVYRSRTKSEGNASGFISVEVAEFDPEISEPTLFAEVKGIRLFKEVSAMYLKELSQ